jgi:uncharacterized BrkB/YihY/UPF0761 family membrane protein
MTQIAPSTQRRPIRVADLIVTIVLLLVPPAALVAVAVGGIFLALTGADSAGDTESAQSLTFAIFVACIVVAIAGTTVSIVFLVKRRRAWWVALLTAVLVAGAGLLSLYNWATVIG